MASPQVENGYTRIANELLEAMMRFNFTRHEARVVLCVIRETYGRGKKQVILTHKEISTMTRISRSHISRTISKLVPKLVLIRQTRTKSDTKYKQLYEINKNYDEWVEKLVPKVTPKTRTKSGTKTRTKSDTSFQTLPLYERKERKSATSKKWIYKNKQPVPPDFCLTSDLKSYGQKLLAKHQLVIDLEDFTEDFILKCKSKGFKYKDFRAAWQTWLRNQIKWDLEKQKPDNDVGCNYGDLDDGFQDDIR